MPVGTPSTFLDPIFKSNGEPPELLDEVRGIAATVARIDQELENYREERDEQRKLFAQMATDMKAYRVSMEKLAALFLAEWQKKKVGKGSARG